VPPHEPTPGYFAARAEKICDGLSNSIELWLSKIERNVIARGIFTSTSDMTRKLMRYIRDHNKTAKPIKWKYVDVARRFRAPHSAVTGPLVVKAFSW
jgi:hypothetical protein